VKSKSERGNGGVWCRSLLNWDADPIPLPYSDLCWEKRRAKSHTPRSGEKEINHYGARGGCRTVPVTAWLWQGPPGGNV